MKFDSSLLRASLGALVILALSVRARAADVPGTGQPRWAPLFNGRDLTGWQTLPGGQWLVLDGEIIGLSTKTDNRHGLLITEREYGDFRVRLKFKAITGNSGLYFRVQKTTTIAAVKGLQAEITSAGVEDGGLYETHGRNWVAKSDPAVVARIWKRADWNEMEVHAIGGDVTVILNGTKTVELRNDPGLRKGYIALQLHGRQDMDVRYKEIEIAVVGP